MRRVLVFSELCEESRNPSTHFFKGEKECPPLAREKGGGKITSKKSPDPIFQRGSKSGSVILNDSEKSRERFYSAITLDYSLRSEWQFARSTPCPRQRGIKILSPSFPNSIWEGEKCRCKKGLHALFKGKIKGSSFFLILLLNQGGLGSCGKVFAKALRSIFLCL